MNYYDYLRRELFRIGKNGYSNSLLDMNIPSELREHIYRAMEDTPMAQRYNSRRLNEEDWGRIETACAVYDSPLMKALE